MLIPQGWDIVGQTGRIRVCQEPARLGCGCSISTPGFSVCSSSSRKSRHPANIELQSISCILTTLMQRTWSDRVPLHLLSPVQAIKNLGIESSSQKPCCRAPGFSMRSSSSSRESRHTANIEVQLNYKVSCQERCCSAPGLSVCSSSSREPRHSTKSGMSAIYEQQK